MKSLKMIIVSFVCIFLMTAAAGAQDGAGKKAGFLDLSKVFDKYEKTREYDSALEGKHKAYETERNAKIDKLKEVQGKLALLKEEEKAAVERELEQLTSDLRDFDQAQKTDLTKQRDEQLREILLEIEKVVSDFAKKEKYDLILNDRVLIYGNETFDVTDKILNILNEKYNKK